MAITDTATDTSTDTTPATAPGATGFALPAPAGIVGLLGSGDHKTLGRFWIAASGVFGIGSTALLAWFLAEAATDAASQTDRAGLNFTLAVIGLVLGFVVPLFIGLATVVVPLQVGASTIAFPRAAAAALWSWLLSAALLAISYLPALDGGVGGAKVDGSVLTYLGLAGVVASLLLATICILTTIITLRPPGMALDRVPLFSWSMLAAGGLWLLTLPMLGVNAAFISIDLKYGTPALFGAKDLQWTQLSWMVLAPQVFAYSIPVLGIVGDAVATFAQRRQPQRGVMLAAIGAFAAVSFGVDVQPAFDRFAFRQWTYILVVLLLALPLLVMLGGVIGGLRKGVRSLTSPLVLGVAALLLLLIGALTAIPFVIGPLGLQATDAELLRLVPAMRLTTAGPPVYTWGVFGIAIGGAITGAVAGLFHWGSKTTGRQLPDGLGKVLAPVMFVGSLLLGVPFLVLGFADHARGVLDAIQILLILAIVGAVLLLVGAVAAVALTLVNRVAVIGGAAGAGPDPWGGGTSLEWATDSPPAPGNFGALPPVTSPEPLLDLNDGGAR
jgi:heme/copper-type cytochrome/quinol oxidase subunit 1